MSRSGDITLDFGGEERTFRLGYGQWRKIQEKCDAGPPEILARLSQPFFASNQGLKWDAIIGAGLLGTWRVDDIREVVLQGLLGANMPGPEALKLVRDWVEERPPIEGLSIAYRIVFSWMNGAGDEDPVGKSQAAPAASDPSIAEKSGSEKTASTPPAPQSASPLDR